MLLQGIQYRINSDTEIINIFAPLTILLIGAENWQYQFQVQETL
jgi:hypothetical protein